MRATNFYRDSGRTKKGHAFSSTIIYRDLLEPGDEAVGECDARCEISAGRKERNQERLIYYSKNDGVRGVLLCNGGRSSRPRFDRRSNSLHHPRLQQKSPLKSIHAR